MTSKAVYTKTSIEIIKRALRLIRVADAELPIEAIERNNGLDALNGFVKFLQTEGFNLWRETEALIPLQAGKQSYSLGPNGDHAFDVDDFIDSKLSVDALTGDALISLDSTSGLVASQNILTSDPARSTQGWSVVDGTVSADSNGLELKNVLQGYADQSLKTVVGTTYILQCDYVRGTDSGADFEVVDYDGEIVSLSLVDSGKVRLEFTARQKQTTFRFKNATSTVDATNLINNFNYIDKSQGDNIGVFLDDGTVHWSNIIYLSPFEIAQPLPSDALAGNTVYTYSDLIDRPMGVNQVRYRDQLGFSDTPTTEWTRPQYFDQPDKSSQGTVTKWYYSPQLKDGKLYVWQPASSNKALLPITYIRPLYVTDENADDVDFPSEWYDLLSYGVANNLTAEYEVADKVLIKIESKYNELLDQALGFDNDGFVNISIDYEGRR